MCSLQSEDVNYWIDRWEKGQTQWHKDYIDPVLKMYMSHLKPSNNESSQESSVFVPMCGKTLDMLFLSDEKFDVVGCDVSEVAVQQFCTENSLTYRKVEVSQDVTMYSVIERKITLAVGSVYNCTLDGMGMSPFDCVWDCNALVAMNPEDREKYAATISSLLKPGGKMLLSTLEYDQSFHTDFPHSIPETLVRSLFEPCNMTVTLLDRRSPSNDEFVGHFMKVCKVLNAIRPIFVLEKKA